jgi:hypothetical protein
MIDGSRVEAGIANVLRADKRRTVTSASNQDNAPKPAEFDEFSIDSKNDGA